MSPVCHGKGRYAEISFRLKNLLQRSVVGQQRFHATFGHQQIGREIVCLLLCIANCAIGFREHGLMHEQVSDFVGYVKANALRCLVRINRNVGNAIEDETERVHFPAHVRHTECANTVRLRQIQHAGQRILPIAPFIAKHGRALFRRDGLFRTVRQIIVRQHEVIGDPVEEQQRIAAMADGGLALSCRGFAQRTKPYPVSRQVLNGRDLRAVR